MSPHTESGSHRRTPLGPGPIALIVIGSWGDIHACIALGRELRNRGYRIRVVTSHRYADSVTEAGLEFAPVSIDVEHVLGRVGWKKWQDRMGVTAARQVMSNFSLTMIDMVLGELLDGCADARAILSPGLGALGAHIGERQGVPYAFVALQPWWRPPVPASRAGRSLGRGMRARFEPLGYILLDRGLRRFVRWRISRLRTAAVPGLPALARTGSARSARRRELLVLCGFSSQVVSPPAELAPSIQLTGFWSSPLSEGWTPPQDLLDFLEAGQPPVYVGFGSWQPKDAAEVHRLVAAALRRAGVRGLLAGADGAGDPGRYGPDMFVVGQIPHEWLFPRCAAVVHHGGSGTTAAGLRAGVPTVVCPFFGDQPFWGSRVAALGAGPEPIPIKQLSAETLGDMVRRAVTDPAMRAAAADLGRRLRAENGVERACDLVEERLAATGGGAGNGPGGTESGSGRDAPTSADPREFERSIPGN